MATTAAAPKKAKQLPKIPILMNVSLPKYDVGDHPVTAKECDALFLELGYENKETPNELVGAMFGASVKTARRWRTGLSTIDFPRMFRNTALYIFLKRRRMPTAVRIMQSHRPVAKAQIAGIRSQKQHARHAGAGAS